MPKRFLNDRSLLPQMFAGGKHRAFNVFMLLWRQYMESGTPRRRALPLDIDGIAASLELEQRDILVVTRHSSGEDGDYSARPPNHYCLKPLLSPEEIAKAWEAMEEQNGAEKMKQARGLSAMLDRPHSRETTKSFIYAIDTFGYAATLAKTKEVQKFAPQNPYRHVGTVIYWLRREAEEKK